MNGTTALEALKGLYHSAGVLRHWRAVRYCSSLLNHTVDSISPFITTVLVNGKQVRIPSQYAQLYHAYKYPLIYICVSMFPLHLPRK